MYSKSVLNVFNNPQNAGRISKPDGIADCYNENQTAHVEFSLRIENGIITDCKFRAQANPYIVAICSTITNMLKGKMSAMIFIDPYSIKQTLGDENPQDISFCIDCVKMAIDDYKDKLQKTNTVLKGTQENVVDDEQNIESTTEENLDEDDIDFSDLFDED